MTNPATPDYDPENIFAKILRGELPCHKVFEDDDALVFMDIMPRADGHALIIPKAPSRNVLSMAPADLAKVIQVVQKVAVAAKAAFEADGIIIQQFNEPASGQIVYHTHFHVVPCRDGVALRPPASEMADEKVLAAHAEKLRAAL